MAAMTLSRVLRYVKRVKERIATVDRNISTYNSIVEGNERPFDMAGLFAECDRLVGHLIDVKIALQNATRPISHHIFRIAEIKGRIALLSSLSTANGLVSDYLAAPQKYSAFLTADKVQAEVVDMQKDLDNLQGKIDAHNYVTTIDIETIV